MPYLSHTCASPSWGTHKLEVYISKPYYPPWCADVHVVSALGRRDPALGTWRSEASSQKASDPQSVGSAAVGRA
eukprot:6786769-Prymnesium_polylepis.1